MRSSERESILIELAELVTFVTSETPQAVLRLAEWSGRGWAGGGTGNGSRGRTGGSPVESAFSRPDTHAMMRRMLDRDLMDALTALRSARATIRQSVPLPIVNEEASEGCVSCKRVNNHWSPVHAIVRLEAGPGRPRKDAEPGVPLCVWCGPFYRSEGHLPAASLVEQHLQGRRVTQRDVDRAERAS